MQVFTNHDRVHLRAHTFNHIQSLLKLPGFPWDHCFAISAENAVALNCKNKFLFVEVLQWNTAVNSLDIFKDCVCGRFCMFKQNMTIFLKAIERDN